MLSIIFPPLDPVLVEWGPLVIRWYALAYLAGFILGWWRCQTLSKRFGSSPSVQDYDDFLSWAVVGTILGGRLGYVLFYQFDYYLSAPLEALKVWHGGMSFHGGMLGVGIAAWLFVRRRRINWLRFTDILSCVAPIGLGLGRLANFVNGELFGRPTDVPWGVIFPHGGDLPRHPSQLYEAALEGVVLYIILAFLARFSVVRQRQGILTGAFLISYAIFRFIVEFFRQPDPQLGYLYAGATMGQLLCVPMCLLGLFIVWYSLCRHSLQKR
ncbi:MAG: prolipoprotein diacylglyceryl transferase [Bdellovibrionales bacterium]